MLNLYGGSRFDLACQDQTWIGGGRFEEVEDGIGFHFEILTKRGEQVPNPPVMRLEAGQSGNELVLHEHHGKSYRLVRRL